MYLIVILKNNLEFRKDKKEKIIILQIFKHVKFPVIFNIYKS
jgi:hypothetical protein